MPGRTTPQRSTVGNATLHDAAADATASNAPVRRSTQHAGSSHVTASGAISCGPKQSLRTALATSWRAHAAWVRPPAPPQSRTTHPPVRSATRLRVVTLTPSAALCTAPCAHASALHIAVLAALAPTSTQARGGSKCPTIKGPDSTEIHRHVRSTIQCPAALSAVHRHTPTTTGQFAYLVDGRIERV